MQAFSPFLPLQRASNTHFIEDSADGKAMAATVPLLLYMRFNTLLF